MESDTAREEKAMRALESRLMADYAQDHSAGRIADTILNARNEFAGHPIRDFVPILVERMARRDLAAVTEKEPAEEEQETNEASEEHETPETVGVVDVEPKPGPLGGSGVRWRGLVGRRYLLPALGGVGALVLVLAVGVAVTRPEPAPTPVASTPLTKVRGVVGSEKMAFFSDPRVIGAFAGHGVEVAVELAGSREIATGVDLGDYDFAFPSSLPAADRVKHEVGVNNHYTPFYSPMAIATFDPIVDVLTRAGVVRPGPVPTLDVSAYLDLVARDVQWDQLEGNTAYPVRKNVLVSTSDPRSSNSAAMYLAVAGYVANDNAVVRGSAAEQHVLPLLSRLTLGQGYTEGSTAGPFAGYLDAGMGPTPMAWIYESQYVSATINGKIDPDMALLYPSPTVVSRHALVPLGGHGDTVGRLLATDPILQSLAAEHGYRTGNAEEFEQVVAEHDVPVTDELVDVVDVPAYETLERLLVGVETAYR